MALALSWNDFEDSIQYSVALLQEMNGVVTRNPTDYKEAEIIIWRLVQRILNLFTLNLPYFSSASSKNLAVATATPSIPFLAYEK